MARPGISTKNTEKIPPGPKFWTPRIYPQNTPKIPKKYPQNTPNAHFWYFIGILGVFSWGSRISAQGVFFSVFFVEIPGGAISGLCSRSGRSQDWSVFSRRYGGVFSEFPDSSVTPSPSQEAGHELRHLLARSLARMASLIIRGEKRQHKHKLIGPDTVVSKSITDRHFLWG